MKLYLKGNEQDYKKAVASFERALAADPTYSQAAFYLGRTYSALFDYENAGRFYKQAIQLDPDYLEAHANYGGRFAERFLQRLLPSSHAERNRFPSVLRRHRHPHAHLALGIAHGADHARNHRADFRVGPQ